MYNYYDAVYNDLESFMAKNYSEDELLALTVEDIENIAYEEEMIVGGGEHGYDYPEVISEYVRDNLYNALMCVAEYEDLRDFLTNTPTQNQLYIKLDNLLRLFEVPNCAEHYYEDLHREEH